MSNKNVLNPIGQPPREASPAEWNTKEPQAELRSEVTAIESEIAARAYRLWLERGCPEGSPEDDWFLAERELRRTWRLNRRAVRSITGSGRCDARWLFRDPDAYWPLRGLAFLLLRVGHNRSL